MEYLFALPGSSILHLTTVPLCLQFIFLFCWTLCGLCVFRCGAFALDPLLCIIIITVVKPLGKKWSPNKRFPGNCTGTWKIRNQWKYGVIRNKKSFHTNSEFNSVLDVFVENFQKNPILMFLRRSHWVPTLSQSIVQVGASILIMYGRLLYFIAIRTWTTLGQIEDNLINICDSLYRVCLAVDVLLA